MNRPNRNHSTRVINEHAKANDSFFFHLVCLWCIPACIIMGNVCMISKFTLLVSRLLLVCRRATPQLNKQNWETIWRNGPQTQLPNMFASIGSRVAWSLLSTNLAKKWKFQLSSRQLSFRSIHAQILYICFVLLRERAHVWFGSLFWWFFVSNFGPDLVKAA